MKSEQYKQGQLYANDKVECNVTLGFHPSYYAHNYDVEYSRQYYFEPSYRIKMNRKVAKMLYHEFGEYGMGNPSPLPALSVGIQNYIFMNAVLGGRLIFKKDEEIQISGTPLCQIDSIEDLKKLGDIDWPENQLLQDFLAQIDYMKRLYPHYAIDEIQGVYRDGPEGQNSFLTMHTPYTTAFRLFGQRILELMLLEQDFCKAIFAWLMQQYLSLWDTICNRSGWYGTKLHIGDCAATMLSPDIYERLCLPLYREIMQSFEGCVIHSCGPSSHLLEHFAQIPKVKQLQLGYGTNLKQARHLFPDSSIVAYYDPGRFLTDTPPIIEKNLWLMAEQLEDNYIVNCGGTDPETPRKNLIMYLETGKKITQQYRQE